MQARNLKQGQTVVGKSGSEATVYRVVVMASGVAVTLDTEYGSVERVYEPDEDVEVKGDVEFLIDDVVTIGSEASRYIVRAVMKDTLKVAAGRTDRGFTVEKSLCHLRYREM